MNVDPENRPTQHAAAERDGLEIQRDVVARFFLCNHVLVILLATGWIYGLGILLAAIYAYTFGRRLTQQQAAALRYCFDRSTLRVESGVYFLKRKTIPLDHITDVALVQGPVLRWFGLWALQVQTAGKGGQAYPEATLWGLAEPEAAREQLIHLRDEAVRRDM